MIEGFTRPVYSQSRNYLSQLATRDGATMQVAKFFVCGALVLLYAQGLARC